MTTKGGGAIPPKATEAKRALAPAAQRALEEAAERREREVHLQEFWDLSKAWQTRCLHRMLE